MNPSSGYPTYCCIEAPNSDLADTAKADRLMRIITFDKKPSKDASGRYDDLVLHVDECTALMIVAEIQFFAGILTLPTAPYRYAARMRLVHKDDYLRLPSLGWSKRRG